MSGGYPVHQIMVIRGLVAVPLILLIIHFSRGLGIIKGCNAGFHMFRGALMFTAFMAFYIALAEISLTVTTALFFTAPFFITLLSIPLLGEKVGMRRFVSIIIGFIGVLIVLRPDTNANGVSVGLMGLLPIVAAFFYALCQLMVRVGKNSDPVSVMTLYASVTFILLGGIAGLILSFVEPAADDPLSTRFLLQHWALPQSWDWLFFTPDWCYQWHRFYVVQQRLSGRRSFQSCTFRICDDDLGGDFELSGVVGNTRFVDCAWRFNHRLIGCLRFKTRENSSCKIGGIFGFDAALSCWLGSTE